MAHAPTRPSLPQLRGLLTASERLLLDAACAESDGTRIPMWLVGGAVRDLALGRDVHDLDLALAADASAFAGRVAARLRGPAVETETEPRFGTASLRVGATDEAARAGPARLDLARLRTEHYVAPGALPEVTFVDDVEADLARRDFTVNAMALGLAGGVADVLADPFGGLGDLAARRLRVLHPASFADDATRLWRGARTAALFDLAPDRETTRLIAAGASHLDSISGDRISAELRFTAARGRSGRILALAEAWGVLRGTHPALRLDEVTARALRHRPGPVPFELFMGLLLAPLPGRAGILARLNASRGTVLVVEQAAQLLAAGVAADLGPEALSRLAPASPVARQAARALDAARQAALQRALGRWERTRPHLDAARVMALGVPQGPRLGLALERLRRGRYLGTLNTTADAEREVRRMVVPGGDVH